MKATHRPDIFTFSEFDESRNLDFNGYFLARPGGNVLVDPVAMSEHDLAHAKALGGVAWIVVTNSDHTRQTAALAEEHGARVVAPAAERESFPIAADRFVTAGEDWLAGIEIVAFDGSKTPGELALVVDETTLITGDLIRCHAGGSLTTLPPAKLTDAAAARRSIGALLEAHPRIDAVLVGDGWPMFSAARPHLETLV